MTQVQTMTNPELNRALAELMGYSVRKSAHCYQIIKGPSYGKWQAEESHAWSDAPDYCTDPAASLEVQTAAIVKDAEKYMRNLVAVRWVRQDAAEMTELSLIGAADLHLASPRERAEAAYITLSSKQ